MTFEKFLDLLKRRPRMVAREAERDRLKDEFRRWMLKKRKRKDDKHGTRDS